MNAAENGEAGLTVEVVPAAGVHGIALPWLRDRLEAAVSHVGAAIKALSVTVASDRRMAELNRAWLGREGTTDVLSFRLSAPGEPVEADIAVGAEVAAAEAAARGHDPERELLLYALHGLLHCCGHDDATPERFAAMHAEEDRILRAIGVGPVFAAEGRTR
jgi:probable rRNA maturation factor